MPTLDLQTRISNFKKKYNRNPTQAERDQMQKQSYQKDAKERQRKKDFREQLERQRKKKKK